MIGTDAAHEQRYQLYVRCLFGAALLVRLVLVLFVHPPGQFVYSDMQSYDSVAFELLAGHGSPWQAFRPVGYSMFLALVYRLSDGSRTLVGVLQALMSAALVPWSAQLARAAGAGRVTAVWVALLIATSVPLIFYSTVLLTEVPTTFFLVLSLKQAIAPGWRGRWRWLKPGLALGVAAAMRPNLLLLVPVLLAYLAFGREGLRAGRAWFGSRADPRASMLSRASLVAAMLAMLGCALPLGLVCSYNSLALRRLAGPAANGGLNFYLNFADVRSVHYNGPYGGYWISPVPNGLRFTRDEPTDVPFFNDAHYYRAGVAFVREHPEALWRALDNFREASGLGIQLYWPNWPGFELAFRRYAHFFFAVVLAPALAYLVHVGVELLRRRAHPVVLLLAGCCVMGTLPMYFFLGDPRVRVPFDLIWVVLSGLAIQSGLGLLRERLRRLRSPR
jgi:hypothetical protein